MTAEIIYIPFNKLLLAKHNIRQTVDEEEGDAFTGTPETIEDDLVKRLPKKLPANIRSLACNIHANGLLQPLGVYPDEKDGCYQVYFGARRYKSIAALVKAGLQKKTWPIPCRVSTNEKAVQEALSENLVRTAMHPLDECLAFRELVERGSHTAVSVALGSGPINRIHMVAAM